jgi:hypothetical protein
MRAARLLLFLLASLLAPPHEAADLLSAMRLADTVVTGERRVAIVETGNGRQRLITEGESLAGCTVKRIRADGVDLKCRGRMRSLGFNGRARVAVLERVPEHHPVAPA